MPNAKEYPHAVTVFHRIFQRALDLAEALEGLNNIPAVLGAM